MRQQIKRLWIITGATGGLAVVTFVVGCVASSLYLVIGSLIPAIAAHALADATSTRWACGTLVHVLALYEDDLLTPEGAELISKLVPPPRHAMGERFGDLVDGSSSDGGGQ